MRLFAPFAALLAICLPGVAQAQTKKPIVAVIKIDDLAGTGQADTLSTMIETAVAGTNKFRLIERERLGKLVGEQTRAKGGMVTTRTPGKVGGFEGVDFLIYGTITSISAQQKHDFGGTLLMGLMSGRDKQGPSCSNMVATLSLDVKITDADSGEIRYITRLNETQKSISSCGGPGQIDATLLMRSAADKVASGLVTAIYPIQIAAVQGDGSLILNYGEGSLAPGAVMAVYTKGDIIRDPSSGEVIGNNETKLGLIRVSEVQPRMSKAVALSAFTNAPPVGAIVRAVSLEEGKAAGKAAEKASKKANKR
ncbi:MAG TPA: CsgG/HfaB family protein [Allosphingosinicella sp.]|jgi:hypothetical protein|uniref:CsgG/HfaB family protein n=1 Tax=Allosphingosinicella sp. TaxID=2823234 RepID=UPI002F27B8AB